MSERKDERPGYKVGFEEGVRVGREMATRDFIQSSRAPDVVTIVCQWCGRSFEHSHYAALTGAPE